MPRKTSTLGSNLELSASFNRYVSRHAEIIEDVPKNAYIIFVDPKQPVITRRNISMAKRIKEKVFRAEKRGNRWSVAPLVK